MGNFYDLPGGHNFFGDADGGTWFDTSGNTLAVLSYASYVDGISGATGGSPTGTTAENYPFIKVPVGANGDAVVSAFAHFTPWLTGVTQFLDASHGNNDPIQIVGAYNLTTTGRQKNVATEPAFGIFIETNYLNPSDSYNRHMEFYVNFNTSSGNPGTEDRVLNINYNPANGRVVGSSIRAAHAAYGGVFTVNNDTGIAGASFFEVGYTGAGGGNICGLRHYGNTGEDTIFDIQAPSGKNSKIKLGSGGSAGAAVIETLSTTQIGVTVGAASDNLRIYDAGANSNMAASINISGNGGSAGLQVMSWHSAKPAIIARAISGQTTEPVLKVQDSSATDGPGSIGSSGNVWGIDYRGFTISQVATVAAAGSSQGTAAATATPVVDVTGGDGTKGVLLITAIAGIQQTIVNHSSSVLKVYPVGLATINGAASGAAFSQPANSARTYFAISSSAWWCNE